MRLSPTPKQSTNLRILKSLRSRLIRVAAVGLIATAILGTSGCKSVPFSLPKPSLPKLPAPNLSKLAFWKSENLIAKKGNLPKPPSLSFDSSPARQAIASSNGSASREIQSLRNQIASTKAQLTEPVREPYKYAAKNTLNKLADKAKVDLDSGSSSRNGLPKANIVDSKITQAQRDFQAALARTKKAGNDFSLPNGIKSAKSNANKSLMAVNKSLYNADGKLASAADDVVAKARKSDQLSLFEQRLSQATDKAKAAPAALASSGSSSKSSSNAFGGVAPPKPLAPPTLAADNSLGGSSTKPVSNPLAKQTATPASSVSAEVAELKAQLAQMRSEQQKLIQQQQLALSGAPAPQTAPPAASPITIPPTTAVAPPVAREFVADLTARPAPSYPQMYPSTAPLRTASSANNVVPGAPQNVLRGNFSPVAHHPAAAKNGSASRAPAAAPQPTSHPNSQYPSTPYNSYGKSASDYSATAAPTYAPATRGTQVSFQERANPNLVITASTPVEPARTHVQDVRIPDAVLKGTSNYAPGTVHALR